MLKSGLLVKAPYAQYYADGKKNCEIRSQNCKKKAMIAIIETKTWRVTAVATMVGSFQATDKKVFANLNHCVPESEMKIYCNEKSNNFVWQMENVLALNRPVYVPKVPGCQTWTLLTADTISAIMKAISTTPKKIVVTLKKKIKITFKRL
jgi:hypothetical protein